MRRRSNALGILMLVMLAVAAPRGVDAQQADVTSQRAIGLRIGTWLVDMADHLDPAASPHVEIYLERSLNGDDLLLENSLGYWRIITTEQQTFPATSIEVKGYVVPLLTSLKLYLFESAESALSPYVSGGAGLAFGFEKGRTSNGGTTGTSVSTGFGVRAAAGVELRIVRGIRVTGSARYQWLHFGEDVGSTETYRGLGLNGGITYRFRF
jgi:hypothetical protein